MSYLNDIYKKAELDKLPVQPQSLTGSITAKKPTPPVQPQSLTGSITAKKATPPVAQSGIFNAISTGVNDFFDGIEVNKDGIYRTTKVGDDGGALRAVDGIGKVGSQIMGGYSAVSEWGDEQIIKGAKSIKEIAPKASQWLIKDATDNDKWNADNMRTSKMVVDDVESKEKLWKKAHKNSDGSEQLNIMGGLGEAVPSIAGGLATGVGKTLVGTIAKDTLVQAPISVLTHATSKDTGEKVAMDMAMGVAVPVVLKGIGHGLLKAKDSIFAPKVDNEIEPQKSDTQITTPKSDDEIAASLNSKRTAKAKVPKAETQETKPYDMNNIKVPKPKADAPSFGNNLIDEVMKFKNSDYKWGGSRGDNASKTGTDCSGFTCSVMNKFGVNLPRTANEQMKKGVAVEKGDYQVGDLLFWNTMPKRGLKASHVGVYIGDGKFAQMASSAKDFKITNVNDPYYASKFVGARRYKTNGVTNTTPTSNKATNSTDNTVDDLDNIEPPRLDDAIDDMQAPKFDDAIGNATDDIKAPKLDNVPEITNIAKLEDDMSQAKISQDESDSIAKLIKARANALETDENKLLDTNPLTIEAKDRFEPEITYGDMSSVIKTEPYSTTLNKNYADMSFEELQKHPNYDMHITSRKDVKASDIIYGRKLVDKRRIIQPREYRYDNEVTIVPTQFAPNPQADFLLTKSDVRSIQRGTPTPKALQRLQDDLAKYDNHPDFTATYNKTLDTKETMINKDTTIDELDELVVNGLIKFGVNGADEASAVIQIFKTADETTLVHEVGHYFRRTLTPEEMEVATKIFGDFKGANKIQAEEDFANSFVEYLATGVTKVPELKPVFEKFREWISGMWNFIQGNYRPKGEIFKNSNLHDDFFEAMLGNKEAGARIQKATTNEYSPDGKLLDDDGSVLFQAINKETKEVDIEAFNKFAEPLPKSDNILEFVKDFATPIKTAIGEFKVDTDYMLNKAMERDGGLRVNQIGYIKPTLERPAYIIEVDGKFHFIKPFVDESDNVKKFLSVVSDRDGRVNMVTSTILRDKDIRRIVKNGNVVEDFVNKSEDGTHTSNGMSVKEPKLKLDTHTESITPNGLKENKEADILFQAINKDTKEVDIEAFNKFAEPLPKSDNILEFVKDFATPIKTAIGEFKVDTDYMLNKAMERDGGLRVNQIGYIKPTLERPAYIIEVDGKFHFIKPFVDESDNVKKFLSVVSDRDGRVNMVTAHILQNKGLRTLVKKGNVIEDFVKKNDTEHITSDGDIPQGVEPKLKSDTHTESVAPSGLKENKEAEILFQKLGDDIGTIDKKIRDIENANENIKYFKNRIATISQNKKLTPEQKNVITKHKARLASLERDTGIEKLKEQRAILRGEQLKPDEIKITSVHGKVKQALGEWAKRIKSSDIYNEFVNYNMSKNIDYLQIRADAQRKVSEAMDGISTLYHGLNQFSPEARTAIYRYMTGEDTLLSPALKEFSDNMRNDVTALGQELVDNKVLSQKAFEEWRDTYLHRSYNKYFNTENRINAFKAGSTLEPIKERGVSKTFDLRNEAGIGKFLAQNGIEIDKDNITKTLLALKEGNSISKGGIEVTMLSRGRVKLRKDYTKEQRAKMGEIEDIALVLPETLARLQTMAINAKFLDSIPSSMRFNNVDNLSKTEIEAMGYKLLTGERYGALDGQYINKEIAQDIKHQMADIYGANSQLGKLWQSYVSLWKKSNTIWSVGTHLNNFISSGMMQYMAGASATDVTTGVATGIKAMRSIKRLDELKAKESVNTISKSEKQELKKLTSDKNLMLFSELKAKGMFGRSGVNDLLKQHQASTVPTSILGKLDNKVTALYSAEDDVHRFSLAKYFMEKQGLNIDEAMEQVNRNIPDYSAPMARIPRALRDSGLVPFMSWTYHSMPILARQIKQHPAKAFAIFGVMSASYVANGINPFDNEDIPTDGYRFRRVPIAKDGDDVTTLKTDKWLPHTDLINWAPMTNEHNALIPENVRTMIFGGTPQTIAGLALNHKFYFNQAISEKEDKPYDESKSYYANMVDTSTYDKTKYFVQEIIPTPKVLDNFYNIIESRLTKTEDAQRGMNKAIYTKSAEQNFYAAIGVNVSTYNKAEQKRLTENKDNQ